MALSATITPNVLECESLHLHTPTQIYKTPLDRPNILQVVGQITKPGFEDLRFLIPSDGPIPKTMIFVDNIDDSMTIAALLRAALPKYLRAKGDLLIRTFNSNLETSTRSEFLEDFRNGDTRIWVYTDAAGMGVYIGNIKWGFSGNLLII